MIYILDNQVGWCCDYNSVSVLDFVCTAKAHRKMKQMQIQMQAEKRQVAMQRTIHPLTV